MMKVVVFLVLVLGFAGLAGAQTQKTAKGYFCGFSEGDGGYISIRVGGAEKVYAMYGDEREVQYAGFRNEAQKDFWKLPVGTELIINYVYKRPNMGGGATNIIRKVTLTGKRNRATKSCGFGLDGDESPG